MEIKNDQNSKSNSGFWRIVCDVYHMLFFWVHSASQQQCRERIDNYYRNTRKGESELHTITAKEDTAALPAAPTSDETDPSKTADSALPTAGTAGERPKREVYINVPSQRRRKNNNRITKGK